jgi:hypothetical protein
VYLAAAGLVAASAFWAYRVNYDAKAALGRIAELRREIVAEREALVVLEAEWAWLNRPQRLSRLVETHREALGLAPMRGAHFVDLETLPPPPPETFWVRADPEILDRYRAVALNGANTAALDARVAP